MVTKEEMEKRKFKSPEEMGGDKASLRVTAGEIASFDKDENELPSDVDTVIFDYCQKHGLKRSNAVIAEYCHTNEKTLREYLNGNRRITREFLYKLAIGLELTLDEADLLFEKCGGKLNADNRQDYIVINAILDHDDIDDFIENFNELVPKDFRFK